MSPPTNNCR